MRVVPLAIGLLLGAAVSAYGQPAAPAPPRLARTIVWDANPACVCTYEVSLDGTVLGVTPTTSLAFPVPSAGLHVLSVVAIDDQMRRSSPATIAEFETAATPLKPCTYQAPVAGSPLETRAIGSTLQGFNPIGPAGVTGNQAERLKQLTAWGWTATLAQFVDGSIRSDRTDRLFLIVTCTGLP